jgi:hypothetical protein
MRRGPGTPQALRALYPVLDEADRAAARTAVELIVERGFARGRALAALTVAFLSQSGGRGS